ncbi:hypothetical protein [Flavitalea sp.]|nr:hypothetical protein [Flavitalea sp.]
MKYLLILFSFTVLNGFVDGKLYPTHNNYTSPNINYTPPFKNYELTNEEVKMMLGVIADSMSSKDSTGEGWYLRKNRTYTANIKENNQIRISNLYYAYERHASIDIADKLIDSYFASNKNSLGYQQLSGYGDEGFFHTDDENFCTFVARKGKVFIRLKVNKLTSKSNPEAVKRIGKQLLSRV